MHRAQQIIDEIVARVSSVVMLQEVTRGQLTKPDVYPSASVSLGDDDAELYHLEQTLQSLTVYIDIFVSSTTAELDTETLNAREQIHAAIMADRDLGIGYVELITFSTQQPPNYIQDGDDYSASTRLEYLIRYTSPINSQSI